MFGALHGLDIVWLHLAPMRPCLDVTIWEASLNAGLLHTYPSLFRSVQCYAYHACLRQLLAFYASLHTCLHVHAWVLLVSVIHTSTQWSYGHLIQTYICPQWTPPFVCFIVCLPSHLLAFSFLDLPCLSCLSAFCLFHMLYASLSFHCLFAGFLFLPLYVHTWCVDT